MIDDMFLWDFLLGCKVDMREMGIEYLCNVDGCDFVVVSVLVL